MRNEFHDTLIILENLFKTKDWQNFVKAMKGSASSALTSQIGNGEVDKFKALYASLNFSQKTIAVQGTQGRLDISINLKSQIIHTGTGAFLLKHEYKGSPNSCEAGDIMWLHIVHNKQQKISFYRLNFMQNKSKNNNSSGNESWTITQTQLHAMTDVKPKIIDLKGTATQIIEEILKNITTQRSGKDCTSFSTYIGSYGLFTYDNMITLPARDVKQIQKGSTIKLADIEQYYRKFYAYPQLCLPLYNLHCRLCPSFYKNIVCIPPNYCFSWRQFPYYYSRCCRFLTFADNINQLVENYLEFSFGELFYYPWANDTVPTIGSLEGVNTIIVETTIDQG